MPDLNNKQSSYWRVIIGSLIFIIIISGIIILAWPKHSPGFVNGRLRVVAGENFWGNIASQLGGRHVDVISIIKDPNADPHLYESSSADASYVSSAKVVILNGLGYDDFMSKLLSVTPVKGRLVLTVSSVLNVPDGSNPHLWYDITRINEVAKAITNDFISSDPANKAYYQGNLSAFDNSLQPILNLISKIKSDYPNAPVAYTEPVPAYMLSSAGLDIKTPIGFARSIEDGTDPSASDTVTMDNLIKTKSIKVLLYNSQTVSPVTESVKNLAKQNGIPVIGVSETMPTESTYQSWQSGQIENLLEALGK